MNYVVACSKDWFKLDEGGLSDDDKVFFASDPSELGLEFLHEVKPRYIFFPHWNWIVDSSIYEAFECVVFHTAPLPYGRGGSPIQNLIAEGIEDAPVCALRMTSVIDGGPIYAKRNVSLAGSLTEIFERINSAINQLIPEIIRTNPIPIEQTGEVHEFKRRGHSDNRIPDSLPLSEVYDRIRMLDADGYPDAYLEAGGYVIEFHSAEFKDGEILARARISKCK